MQYWEQEQRAAERSISKLSAMSKSSALLHDLRSHFAPNPTPDEVLESGDGHSEALLDLSTAFAMAAERNPSSPNLDFATPVHLNQQTPQLFRTARSNPFIASSTGNGIFLNTRNSPDSLIYQLQDSSERKDPLQQASMEFHKQFEDARNKYAFEIESMREESKRLFKQRELLMNETQAFTSEVGNLQAQTVTAQRDLTAVMRRLHDTKKELESEETALNRSKSARETIARQEAAALSAQASALERRAEAIDIAAKNLADRDASLQERECEFEQQVLAITSSLKEREAKASQAEQIAASHLEREESLRSREDAVFRAEREAGLMASSAKNLIELQEKDAIRLAELRDDIERKKLELTVKVAELEEKSRAVEHHQAEAEAAKQSANSELSCVKEQLGVLTSQIESVHLDIDQAHKAREKAEHARDVAINQLEIVHQSLATAEAKCESAQNETQELFSRCIVEKEGLERQAAALKESQVHLDAERSQLATEREAAAVREQQAVEQFETHMAAQEARLVAKAQALEMAEQDLLVRMETVQHAEELCSANKESVDREAELLQVAIIKLEEERELLESRAEDVSNEVLALESWKKSFREEVLKTIGEREKVLTEWQKSLEQKQVDLAQREESVATRERTSLRHVKDLENRVARMDDKERAGLREMADRKSALLSKENEIATLQMQLSEKTAALDAATLQLESQKSMCDREMAEARRMQAEARRATTDADISRGECDDVKRRLVAREERVLQLERFADETASRLGAQSTELASAIEQARLREAEALCQVAESEARLREAFDRDERYSMEVTRWEELVEGAHEEKKIAVIAAAEAKRSAAAAEAAREHLMSMERALDAREKKLKQSWEVFKRGKREHHMKGAIVSVISNDSVLLTDAEEAAGLRPLPPLPQPELVGAAISSELFAALLQRRTILIERETLLQRWSLALESEAVKLKEIGEQLEEREEVAQKALADKLSAEALLLDVKKRENCLHERAQQVDGSFKELQELEEQLRSEKMRLEHAMAGVSARNADLDARERGLVTSETVWKSKLIDAEKELQLAKDTERETSAERHSTQVLMAQLKEQEILLSEYKAHLSTKMEEATSAEALFTKQVTEVQTEFAALEAQKAEIKAKELELIAKSVDLTEKEKHLETLSKELATLRAELRHGDIFLESLQTKELEISADLAALDRTKAEVRNEQFLLQEQQAQLEKRTKEISEREIAVEASEEELNNLLCQLEAKQKLCEELTVNVQKEKECLTAQKVAVAEAEASAKQHIIDAEKQKENAAIAHDRAVNAVNAAAEKASELESQRVALLQQRADLDAITASNDRIQEDLRQRTLDFNARLEDFESQRRSLALEKVEIEQTKKELLTQRDQYARNNHQLVESQSQLALDKELLRRERSALEARLQAFEESKKYAEDALDSAKNALENERMACIADKSEFAAAKKEFDEELRALEGEKRAWDDGLHHRMALQKTEYEVATQLAELNAKANALQFESAEIQYSRKMLKQQEDDLALRMSELKDQTVKVESRAREVDRLEAQLQNEREQLASKEHGLKETELRLKDLQNQVGVQLNTLKDREDFLQVLESDLRSAEQKEKLLRAEEIRMKEWECRLQKREQKKFLSAEDERLDEFSAIKSVWPDTCSSLCSMETIGGELHSSLNRGANRLLRLESIVKATAEVGVDNDDLHSAHAGVCHLSSALERLNKQVKASDLSEAELHQLKRDIHEWEESLRSELDKIVSLQRCALKRHNVQQSMQQLV